MAPLTTPALAASHVPNILETLRQWHDTNGGFKEIAVSPTAAVLTRADVCSDNTKPRSSGTRSGASSGTSSVGSDDAKADAKKLIASFDKIL